MPLTRDTHSFRISRLLLAVSVIATTQVASAQAPMRGLATDLLSTADHFQALDLNGDGKADMLYSRPGGGSAGAYLSHGDGTFRYVSYASGGSGQAGFIGDMSSTSDTFVALDIDGDGKSDFLEYRPGGGFAFECLSLGDGSVSCSNLSTPNGQSNGFEDNMRNGNERIIAADLNGDGKSDFVLWTRNTGNARAYISNGDRTFRAVDYVIGGHPVTTNGFYDTMQNGDENFVAMDLDGDGKSDLLFSSPSHGIVRAYISNSNGSGTIGSATTYSDGAGNHQGFTGNARNGAGRALALNFDGDNKSDFLWYEPGQSFAAIYVSQGLANFLVPVSAYNLHTNGSRQNGFQGDLSDDADTAIVLDFNGDGKSDLLFSRPGSGYATMYISNSTGGQLSAYDYANAGNRSLGFLNDAASPLDTALALNFLGQPESAFVWYRPGAGITSIYAYRQATAQATGNLTSYSFHANPATQMTDLSWSIANTPMKGLVLPGTHDSAMYLGIGPGDINTTQQQTFPQQLASGARVFDFRFGWYDVSGFQFTRLDGDKASCVAGSILPYSDFWMYGHGDACVQENVSQVLGVIRDFLNANPKEIVILAMSGVVSDKDGDRTSEFINELSSVFNYQNSVQIYAQQLACAHAGAPFPKNQCNVASLAPANVTPSTLWALNARLILTSPRTDVTNTGFAWPLNFVQQNSQNPGYCGSGGEGSWFDEFECMDIGNQGTQGGIQAARPDFLPANAATQFLFLDAAITPDSGALNLGVADAASPYNGAYGDSDNGWNSYVQQQMAGGKWQTNSLNLFAFDALTNDAYVNTIIERNDQTWTSTRLAPFGIAAGAIAAGANGDVWAAPVPGGHAISLYRYNPVRSVWAAESFAMPNVVRLAIDPQGSVWAIEHASSSSNYNVVHFNRDGTAASLGTVANDLVDISIGANGLICGVNPSGRVSLFLSIGGFDLSFPNSNAKHCAVGNSGVVWVIDSTGKVWRLPAGSSTWQQMPALPTITTTEPYAYGSSYTAGSATYQAIDMSAGADGSVFVAGELSSHTSTPSSLGPGTPTPQPNSLWRYNPSSNSWDPFRMDAIHVAVAPGGQPWAIRPDGTLYKGAVDQTY